MKTVREYHIGLAQGELAPYVLLCADINRVAKVVSHLSKIELERRNREFVTYTGFYQKVPVSVMGTGIGPDNTEIVLVELSKIVQGATLIRIGSCGAIQRNIKLGDLVISTASVRLENTSTYFVPEGYPAVANQEVTLALIQACEELRLPYHAGLTASAPGFYGAQGRGTATLPSRFRDLPRDLAKIKVLNFEMETSTLFTLSLLNGFRAGAVCAVYAQRVHDTFVTKAQKHKAETRCIEAGLRAIQILADMDRIKRLHAKRFWYPSIG
jgi:uridine phosphorylase